jgi:hypothetical protein
VSRHLLDRSRKPLYPFQQQKENKVKRIPEVRRMTIAAGFRISNGIMFGADTYEGVGDLRDRVHKIPSMHEPYCTAMITGSCSDGHVMDALIERIFDAIHANRPTAHSDLGVLLRDTVLTFYREEIQAFPDGNPGVSLLIAARLPAESTVEAWSAKSSVVRRMQDKEVLGFGAYVRYMLRHLFREQMPPNDAALVMTILLSFAKERVNFVGGDCYISSLSTTHFDTENTTIGSPESENLYNYFLEKARRLILATGNKNLTDEQYGEVFRRFERDMTHYRKKLTATSSADFKARITNRPATKKDEDAGE